LTPVAASTSPTRSHAALPPSVTTPAFAPLPPPLLTGLLHLHRSASSGDSKLSRAAAPVSPGMGQPGAGHAATCDATMGSAEGRGSVAERRRGCRRSRAGRGEGNEAETRSAAMRQHSGARRRPTTGFVMPSGSCWKLLCGCGRRCVGPDVKMARFVHPGGVVLEMV
jgi:hypothetical protein